MSRSRGQAVHGGHAVSSPSGHGGAPPQECNGAPASWEASTLGPRCPRVWPLGTGPPGRDRFTVHPRRRPGPRPPAPNSASTLSTVESLVPTATAATRRDQARPGATANAHRLAGPGELSWVTRQIGCVLDG